MPIDLGQRLQSKISALGARALQSVATQGKPWFYMGVTVKPSDFDPNATAVSSSGIFGLPFNEDNAKLVIQPVPWEVTTSYGDGTAAGPQAILDESGQVDLFDLELGNIFEAGIYSRPIPTNIQELNDQLKPVAKRLQSQLAEVGELTSSEVLEQKQVNAGGEKLNQWLYKSSREILNRGKIAAVLGGDHSSPLGLIQAVSEHVKGRFAILHLDAHADLRNSYQGFLFSHASIMHNVMTSPFAPQKMVQVGIRDFCEDEKAMIDSSGGRIETFFDWELKKAQFAGRTWSEQVAQIIGRLPENVYISFDIDGLDPAFCPNTGTPVPGGLSFDQAVFLLRELYQTGRKIVGFDLNEVSAGTSESSRWDAIVGARMLYKLSCYSLITNV